MWRISDGIKEDEWSQAEKPLLEPEDEPTTKRYVYRVPERTAAYNRALLRESKRNPVESLHRRAIEEIQEEEDRYAFAALEKAYKSIREQRELEDWPGQLRRGSIALPLGALLVAVIPFALTIIWALGQ